MTTFATIDDLNARRVTELSGRAATVATAKLQDASAKVAAELAASGINWQRKVASGEEPFCSNLKAIVCAMVERAIELPLPLGIKTQQGSAGPYSYTNTSANPGGDIYLLASERKTLGIGRGAVAFAMPRIHGRQR